MTNRQPNFQQAEKAKDFAVRAACALSPDGERGVIDHDYLRLAQAS
jgi:hypothetical protein